MIGYNAGYRASWQTSLGGVPATLIEDNRQLWSGDHCVAYCTIADKECISDPAIASEMRSSSVPRRRPLETSGNAPIAAMADRVVSLADGSIAEIRTNAQKLDPSGLRW